MTPMSISRHAVLSGFSQFVAQVVYTQAHQTASRRTTVSASPRRSRCSRRPWDSWVIANT